MAEAEQSVSSDSSYVYRFHTGVNEGGDQGIYANKLSRCDSSAESLNSVLELKLDSTASGNIQSSGCIEDSGNHKLINKSSAADMSVNASDLDCVHHVASISPNGSASVSSTSSDGEREFSLNHFSHYELSGSLSSRYPGTSYYDDDNDNNSNNSKEGSPAKGRSHRQVGKGYAFRRFAESRALSPVILRDEVMDKYADHLLAPPVPQLLRQTSKEVQDLQSVVETIQGSVSGIESTKEELEKRVIQLEEMFKRTLEVMSLQRAGSAPAGMMQGAPLTRSQSFAAADPNAKVASVNGTIANNAPADVEVKDPYTEYLEVCERYGRPFLCDAMLAFTTASTSLKLSTLADQDALPLALALKNNCYICKLEIMGGLTDTGAIHLAQAFKGNDHLKEVVFEKCQVADVGAAALATWLCKCEVLRTFSLHGNIGLRTRAFTALGQALIRNRGLQVLDLSQTDMDDDGLIALMDALSCNQFLSSLDFSRNRITSVGLQQLVKCLRVSVSCAIAQCLGFKLGRGSHSALGQSAEGTA